MRTSSLGPIALVNSNRVAVYKAIGCSLVSAALFTIMVVLIKGMGPQYPIGQILFVRSLFAMVPILWLAYRLSGWQELRTRRISAHLYRSGAGICSMFFTFTAVSMIPLATVMALSYVAPIFVTILAIPMLGETVPLHRWAAVIIGFAGVLLVVHPDVSGISLGAVLSLAGALTAALAMIFIRRMADTESSTATAFYFTLAGVVVGAATLPFANVWPELADIPTLIAIGLVGGIGQILVTMAYQLGAASMVAPFGYVSLVFSLGIGFIIWGELPTMIELFGIFVITISGFVTAFYERQR
ncbi:DMT family transporter [Bradyrhizobium sp. RP6]|uniref:DMT family transporter n=1 Tax=Bradyrhizobium sp. RP6 TaxID=2489596 RepID=UPI000F5339BD|nr:DMT family transporter [Bradyrhizobium sp. RP6]RQH05199.1 DMT family transporter [Bradyrhizobium sp. RP6]